MRNTVLIITAGIFFANITSAQAMRCRDVVFSVRNTTSSVIRITKVRYRDFEDNRQRTTNFSNRTIGRSGVVGHVVGVEIDLKNVRNQRVGEFEFQYQRQTSPPNVFGVSSWGNRRWADRQGNINSCNTNSSASIRIPN